jgi:hypothetical protein
MGEGEDARRDALADFLQESGVPEERWPGVVESLNEILAQVDRGEIAKLQVALDGIQPRAPL